MRKRVQEIGQEQFLMLLFVMKANLDDRPHRFKIVRRLDQRFNSSINVRTIGRRLGNTGTCDQAALRAGLPRTGSDII